MLLHPPPALALELLWQLLLFLLLLLLLDRVPCLLQWLLR
jgi:hypothetical protein